MREKITIGGIASCLLLTGFLGCKSAATTEVVKPTTSPSAQDDPFFKEANPGGEMFRILILKDSYTVKQLSGEADLVKKKDDSGDHEQLERYQELADRYDFKDWDFTGVLTVRLHPHRGEIERIEFVPGQNPKSWQASKLFQEDVSRFGFTFPKSIVTLREFRVKYKWRIKRRDGLSDEDAKKRAVEFLKSQTQ